MTSEKPLLFNDPMVRAILEGRKTQTRRIATPAFGQKHPIKNLKEHGIGDYSGRFNDPWSWGYPFAEDGSDMPLAAWPELCPTGVPGDKIWVRETVASGVCSKGKPSEWSPSFWRRNQGSESNPNGLWYRADDTKPDNPITERGKWYPPMHMPRWACRIKLRITAVKIERLQDISNEDSIAEGISEPKFDPHFPEWSARDEFQLLWNSINTKPGKTWEDNPWVWAITFERVKP